MRTSATVKAKTTGYEGSKRRLKLWLVFVVLFMSWAIYTMINQGYSKDKTQERYLAAQHKLDEIKQAQDQLQHRVNMLTDPEYIKELARKEYGMIMPGEQQIQVSGP
ncbi:FtsB family cell division protein [Paenibacillus sp. SYP-B4298]|uniref:FtsB family cell division protein n=1 Tax=Paenibacillus sp. SYP-B4298 TaxID=2996034 RepID=UPI0022DCFE1C|nr:septum formation initiator family protein [Paenibacillus sp. SYP-B4298]